MHGRRVGIMTSSGGAGVLLSDAAAAEGLAVPEFSRADQDKLLDFLPQPFFGNVSNPVDTTAQIGRPDLFGDLLGALSQIADVDAVSIVTWAGENPSNDAIARTFAETSKPVAVLSTEYMSAFQKQGIPTYLDPTRAMRALGALAAYTSRRSIT